jgi:hypothetical protein
MKSSLSIVCSALVGLVRDWCETCPCDGGPAIAIGDRDVRQVLSRHGWEPAEFVLAVRASVSARWLHFSSLGLCVSLAERLS